MLQKNIERERRKQRPTWSGYAPKKTPTKKEKMKKIDRKHKGKRDY